MPGCARKYTEATINNAYSIHKSWGKRTGKGHLTKEQWTNIVFKPCHYCGGTDTRNSAQMRRREAHRRVADFDIHKWDVQMVGVDRIDPTKGYTLENSLPCCTRCNRMKLNSTYEGFKEEVARVYRFWVANAG